MTSHARPRVLTTGAQMDAALAESRQRESIATKIDAANYDSARDAIVVQLSTGSTLAVPRGDVPGFATAAPMDLIDLEIVPSREGLWSERLDDGVLLDQLLLLAVGPATLRTLGGRVAGSMRTPSRAAASRANGKLGGRPLTMASFVKEIDKRVHIAYVDMPTYEPTSGPHHLPAGAVWRYLDHALYVKIREVKDVDVQTTWGAAVRIMPRSRATAIKTADAFVKALKRRVKPLRRAAV